MFTRLRCLLRFHKWRLTADDLGDSYMECGNCAKSKRHGIRRSAARAEDVGGYGNLY
jgi:hypothetical protein